MLRLAGALASNNQHKENSDIVEWLESATVDDLRLAFPVLLNWCRNSSKKAAKASSKDKNESTLKTAAASEASRKKGNNNSDRPIGLTQTISAEEVAQKIAKVLEEAIEVDAEDTMMSNNNHDDDDGEWKADVRVQQRIHSISSLRMALAGYLHTNHSKMRKIPTVANLEKRTKAKIAFDRAATNTLNMVNAAGPSSMSVSQYLTPEEDDKGSGWGIPHIHIDLGLGLQQASPADVCQEFIKDQKPLLHPFTGETIGRMQVKKVIPSKRKPVWIEYFSPSEVALKPDVLAKQGDDLRNDFSVSCVSSLCETIWKKAPIEWTLGQSPTVCAYNVLVTATDGGYLEMVPGTNFLDFTNQKNGWDAVNVQKLAPSLVGSYIVNFILGVRDRHEDNMMVVGDLQEDPKMMQIDFGYVLMEFPGGVHFDMPRLTMPIPLVDRFNSEPSLSGNHTTLMEDLQYDMLAAYLVLRRHSLQLIPFVSHLMSASYDYKHVESILKGKHVFRTHKSEHDVIQWMSQKLTNQWAHFYFRREIKLGMVRGYYKFVELTSFESNNNNNKDEKESSPASIGRRIKSFFRPSFKPKAEAGENPRSGSFDSSHEDNEEETSEENNENRCVHSNDIDNISQLNERVTNAMKLQQRVSRTMISRKEKHGTLEFSE